MDAEIDFGGIESALRIDGLLLSIRQSTRGLFEVILDYKDNNLKSSLGVNLFEG